MSKRENKDIFNQLSFNSKILECLNRKFTIFGYFDLLVQMSLLITVLYNIEEHCYLCSKYTMLRQMTNLSNKISTSEVVDINFNKILLMEKM